MILEAHGKLPANPLRTGIPPVPETEETENCSCCIDLLRVGRLHLKWYRPWREFGSFLYSVNQVVIFPENEFMTLRTWGIGGLQLHLQV